MKDPVSIYCDGSSHLKTRHGGWGIYIEYPEGNHKEFFGGSKDTTNNSMELTALMESLTLINTDYISRDEIVIHSDSKYAVQGINDWVKTWKRKGWVKNSNRDIANIELWKKLYNMYYNTPGIKERVRIRWVPGHKDIKGNVRADELAYMGRMSQRDN